MPVLWVPPLTKSSAPEVPVVPIVTLPPKEATPPFCWSRNSRAAFAAKSYASRNCCVSEERTRTLFPPLRTVSAAVVVPSSVPTASVSEAPRFVWPEPRRTRPVALSRVSALPTHAPELKRSKCRLRVVSARRFHIAPAGSASERPAPPAVSVKVCQSWNFVKPCPARKSLRRIAESWSRIAAANAKTLLFVRGSSWSKVGINYSLEGDERRRAALAPILDRGVNGDPRQRIGAVVVGANGDGGIRARLFDKLHEGGGGGARVRVDHFAHVELLCRGERDGEPSIRARRAAVLPERNNDAARRDVEDRRARGVDDDLTPRIVRGEVQAEARVHACGSGGELRAELRAAAGLRELVRLHERRAADTLLACEADRVFNVAR